MYFKLNVGRQEPILRALFHDLSPHRVEAIGHLVNFQFLLLQTPLNFFFRLHQEINLRLGHSIISALILLLLGQLFANVPHSVYVEWDHAEGDARLIVLERFLDLDGILFFRGEDCAIVKQLCLAKNDVEAIVPLLE